MLSRVADSIYWMARYMERAENLARLMLANQNLMLDAGASQQDESAFWQPILMTTGDEEGYFKLYSSLNGADVEEYVAVRVENSNSILNCIRTARENARMIRDQITDEVWRAVNDLHLSLIGDKAKQMLAQTPAEFYETVMQGSGRFQGVARATMMRDETWHFFQIGNYLERADQTSRLIDACSNVALVQPPHPDAQPLRWQALLHSCSAWHGYREHHREIEPQSVLEFLFLSETFARSVRFCVREVDIALSSLIAPPSSKSVPDPIRLSGRIRADIAFGSIEEILEIGLHEFIDGLQARLGKLGSAIFETYVLYADLAPLTIDPPSARTAAPLGAWHSEVEVAVQQQQQQQQ